MTTTAVADMTMREREEAMEALVAQVPAKATALQEAELKASRLRGELHSMIKQAEGLGATQQRLSDASGLSRQRIQQIARAASA